MPGTVYFRAMRKKAYDSREGYDLYSEYYRKDHDLLDSFDWSAGRRLIQPHVKGLILDLGCGDGRILNRLSREGADIIGCDVSFKMLKQLKKMNPGAKLVQGDAYFPPFKPGIFDLILGFFLVVHIRDMNYFFQEAYSMLKPGGLLIVNNIPQYTSPILTAGKEKFVIEARYHNDTDVVKNAEESGLFLEYSFEEVQKETKVSTLFIFKKG
jgi:SAM-dependent methyltransferase